MQAKQILQHLFSLYRCFSCTSICFITDFLSQHHCKCKDKYGPSIHRKRIEETATKVLHHNPRSELKREKAFGRLDPDHHCECDITLCDAGLPAAVEIKRLTVSHARMQSRPSDSREQKVGRRHVSGRGSRGAFVRRQWQKGVEGAFARRYSETICKPGCWSQAKDSRTAGALPWLINVGLQELHFDMNEDKSATTFCECLILPSLSGQTPCPQLGIHNAKREVSTPW